MSSVGPVEALGGDDVKGSRLLADYWRAEVSGAPRSNIDHRAAIAASVTAESFDAQPIKRNGHRGRWAGRHSSAIWFVNVLTIAMRKPDR